MRSFYDSLKAIINLNTRVLNMKKVLGVAGVGLVGAAAFMFSGVYTTYRQLTSIGISPLDYLSWLGINQYMQPLKI